MTYSKRFVNKVIVLFCGLLLVGCEMMDYHPYDSKFSGARGINAKNVQRIEQATSGRKELRFAVISDTQRWYDETHLIVDHINASPDIDFVIHCGDLTDFSLTDEFVWMRDELQRLQVPYVVALGNHDCLGTGKQMFSYMYGDFEYSFTAGNTHFAVINTNGLEFPVNPKFFGAAFLTQNFKALPSCVERTIIVMHVPPGSDQFDVEDADGYLAALKPYPALQFGLCGHEHSFTIRHPFSDGVPYYQAACADKLSYLLFHLKADGTYEYEEIQL